MLEISLITVIYKRIGKFWYITQSELTAVNGDIFIKYLQGGTFAFEHLYLQISDSHITCEVFLS
jgi:hypothetical protein